MVPTLVGPPWKWAAEVRGHNGVCDFVREHAVQDAFAASLDRHLPVDRLTVEKYEACGATGAQLRADRYANRATALPLR